VDVWSLGVLTAELLRAAVASGALQGTADQGAALSCRDAASDAVSGEEGPSATAPATAVDVDEGGALNNAAAAIAALESSAGWTSGAGGAGLQLDQNGSAGRQEAASLLRAADDESAIAPSTAAAARQPGSAQAIGAAADQHTPAWGMAGHKAPPSGVASLGVTKLRLEPSPQVCSAAGGAGNAIGCPSDGARAAVDGAGAAGGAAVRSERGALGAASEQLPATISGAKRGRAAAGAALAEGLRAPPATRRRGDSDVDAGWLSRAQSSAVASAPREDVRPATDAANVSGAASCPATDAGAPPVAPYDRQLAASPTDSVLRGSRIRRESIDLGGGGRGPLPRTTSEAFLRSLSGPTASCSPGAAEPMLPAGQLAGASDSGRRSGGDGMSRGRGADTASDSPPASSPFSALPQMAAAGGSALGLGLALPDAVGVPCRVGFAPYQPPASSDLPPLSLYSRNSGASSFGSLPVALSTRQLSHRRRLPSHPQPAGASQGGTLASGDSLDSSLPDCSVTESSPADSDRSLSSAAQHPYDTAADSADFGGVLAPHAFFENSPAGALGHGGGLGDAAAVFNAHVSRGRSGRTNEPQAPPQHLLFPGEGELVCLSEIAERLGSPCPVLWPGVERLPGYMPFSESCEACTGARAGEASREMGAASGGRLAGAGPCVGTHHLCAADRLRVWAGIPGMAEVGPGGSGNASVEVARAHSLLDLALRMLTFDPAQRPTAQRCLQHPSLADAVADNDGAAAAPAYHRLLAWHRGRAERRREFVSLERSLVALRNARESRAAGAAALTGRLAWSGPASRLFAAGDGADSEEEP